MDNGKSPSAPLLDASTVPDLSPTLADLLGGSSITTTKLNGSSNFLQWSASITTYLLSKDRLHYIDVVPPSHPDAKWIREDAQVRSWLWNSMEAHISSDVVLLKTAHEVYASVADSFASDKNVNRIFELCDEIFRTKQQGRSLKDYYSFVKGRWEELGLYQPFPKDLETWKHQREQLKVVSFLAGLDSSYASSRNQFLSGADLPSLSVTFSRLSRIPIDVDDTNASDSSALTTQSRPPPPPPSHGRGRGRGRGGGRQGRREDRFCEFCNSPGHVEDKCWSKHGKPDWAKQASSTPAPSLVAAAPSDSPSPPVSHNVTLS